MKQLTQNQINQLTYGKKHWSLKKDHLIKLAKNFGIQITSDEELQYLIEQHCPNEEARIKRKFFSDSQKGIINTYLTPTDVDGNFPPIINPVIGHRYHLSWAFKGAVFVLKRIEGEFGYVDNPKHKRKELLKCNLKDLRCVKKHVVA